MSKASRDTESQRQTAPAVCTSSDTGTAPTLFIAGCFECMACRRQRHSLMLSIAHHDAESGSDGRAVLRIGDVFPSLAFTIFRMTQIQNGSSLADIFLQFFFSPDRIIWSLIPVRLLHSPARQSYKCRRGQARQSASAMGAKAKGLRQGKGNSRLTSELLQAARQMHADGLTAGRPKPSAQTCFELHAFESCFSCDNAPRIPDIMSRQSACCSLGA